MGRNAHVRVARPGSWLECIRLPLTEILARSCRNRGTVEDVMKYHGEWVSGEVGWESWVILDLPVSSPGWITGTLSKNSRMGHDG
jgi:hypothetical protein